MRTSADSSQPERASLESSCSASSAHGTARTEAQRLGILACLATSNFKHVFCGPCRARPAALFTKSERLQIAPNQKELAWRSAAQPHLSMALLAQRQRLRLIACLATGTFKHIFCCPCRVPAAALLPNCERL